MEDKFLCIIAEIIEMIQTKNYSSVFYDGNLFHISDDKRKMDFQVKFGKNAFSVQDNTSNLKYMYSKEFIDRITSIRQIFLDDGESKDYFSFFKRDEDVGIVRVAQINSKKALLCTNYGIVGKEHDEILDYIDMVMEEEEIETNAYEQFQEGMESSDEIVEKFEDAAESFVTDKGFKDNKKLNEFGESSSKSNGNSYDFENDKKIESDEDLNNYYDHYYDENNSESDAVQDDEVDAENFDDIGQYDEYKVIVNGKEVTKEKDKSDFVIQCGIDVSEAYWGAVIMEMCTDNLKNALRYLDNEKDIEFEK